MIIVYWIIRKHQLFLFQQQKRLNLKINYGNLVKN